jgi:hypothetical protein
MGKTLTLRILQEYAHREGFATSFLTLTSRECPMYDLPDVYRHIVKGIRVVDCLDKPALEYLLASWAQTVRNYRTSGAGVPRVIKELDADFVYVLTQYYDGVHSIKLDQTDLALRWLFGETNPTEARRLGVNAILSNENALDMLGNLTRMLRFAGVKGLVILLDETDAIPYMPNAATREEAYANLFRLSRSASSTPYSYFAYATTPAFLDCIPSGYDAALKNITTLHQLTFSELIELAEVIRDLHFMAYEWHRHDIDKRCLRKFVKECTCRQADSPRRFVRTLVSALDACEENRGLTLGQIGQVLI